MFFFLLEIDQFFFACHFNVSCSFLRATSFDRSFSRARSLCQQRNKCRNYMCVGQEKRRFWERSEKNTQKKVQQHTGEQATCTPSKGKFKELTAQTSRMITVCVCVCFLVLVDFVSWGRWLTLWPLTVKCCCWRFKCRVRAFTCAVCVCVRTLRRKKKHWQSKRPIITRLQWHRKML